MSYNFWLTNNTNSWYHLGRLIGQSSLLVKLGRIGTPLNLKYEL